MTDSVGFTPTWVHATVRSGLGTDDAHYAYLDDGPTSEVMGRNQPDYRPDFTLEPDRPVVRAIVETAELRAGVAELANSVPETTGRLVTPGDMAIVARDARGDYHFWSAKSRQVPDAMKGIVQIMRLTPLA